MLFKLNTFPPAGKNGMSERKNLIFRKKALNSRLSSLLFAFSSAHKVNKRLKTRDITGTSGLLVHNKRQNRNIHILTHCRKDILRHNLWHTGERTYVDDSVDSAFICVCNITDTLQSVAADIPCKVGFCKPESSFEVSFAFFEDFRDNRVF